MDKANPKRKLKINMWDLESGFTNSFPFEHFYYLDLETGEVILITREDDQRLKEVYKEYGDPDTGDVDWEKVLPQLEIQDWEKDTLLIADMVDDGYGTRFIKVPDPVPYEAYNDRVDFIYTISNIRLRDKLEYAIHGKGAFRRFKDILYDYPKERECWFEFSNNRLQKRMEDWLEMEGIELIE